ncbi:MAG: TIGR03790 family protein [Nitrospirae bacterium]|nr:TIGR03790 family protein [Nitrospirota bacterium]
MRRSLAIVLVLAALLAPRPARALDGADVVVVYNRKASGSQQVADHYMAARGVPRANRVAVAVPDAERMARRDLPDMVAPIRKRVDALKAQGRAPVVLLAYGVPLRVEGEEPGGTGAFLKTVQKGRDQARKAANGAVAELLAALGDAPRDLAALPEAEFIRFSRERAKHAATRLAAAIQMQGAEDTVWTLRAALRGATGGAGLRTDEAAMALDLQFRGIPTEGLAALAERVRAHKGALGELSFWNGLVGVDPANENGAAVDSELALALGGPHQTAARLPNPLLAEFDRTPGIGPPRATIVPVARLDGPTPQVAMRLVDDAVAVERDGLSGTAYIDARGKTGDSPYAGFDAGLRRAAARLQAAALPVVLDDRPELLAGAPDAALYAGWYALGRYAPVFTWKRGAVGYHAASVEAQHLHDPAAQNWCKRMLESGAAATLGPVAEPYLDAFPDPGAFFAELLAGEPLVTAFYRTIPHLSWRMVLIGDPLYRPFAAHPRRI